MKWTVLFAALAVPASAQGILPHAQQIDKMQIELRLPPGIALREDRARVILTGDAAPVELALHRIEDSRRFAVPAGTRVAIAVSGVTPAFALCATGQGSADAIRYRLLRPGIPPGEMHEMTAGQFAPLAAC